MKSVGIYQIDGSQVHLIDVVHGPVFLFHAPSHCDPERSCVIHRPSEHHMRSWPLVWRDDRGIFERMCPHGTGHPDPDGPVDDRVHGCCRAHCCHGGER